MQLYVWMAGWQMECCGTPFREGAAVSWRLRHPNSAEPAWLDTVLQGGVAATIDAIEDHHGDSSAPLTEGTVTSIATLHCRFAPEPVAGSGLMTSVATAEKWNDDLDGRHFAGFLARVVIPNSARLQGQIFGVLIGRRAAPVVPTVADYESRRDPPRNT